MRKSVGAAVFLVVALVPNIANAASVHVFGASPFSDDNRAEVIYDASPGESNSLTVSRNGSTVVFSDSNAAIDTGTPEECTITNSAHTASCTPKPERCTVVSQEPGQPPVVSCTPIDPSQVPVPTVRAFLGDSNDTLVNTASIPFKSSGGTTFPGFTGFGGAGADDLIGSSTDDYLLGDSGDDTLTGMGGRDLLIETDDSNGDEEPGDDHLFGGDGHDTLAGGAGGDELRGEAGTDQLFGGLGDNTIDGGAGVDGVFYSLPTLFDENDVRIPTSPDQQGATVVLDAAEFTSGNGLPGQDDVIAGVEDVSGTEGADTLTGSSVGNLLDGQQGNDTVAGGEGTDVLFGRLGADTLASSDGQVDRVDCGGQVDDLATVDDIDQAAACPAEGGGLTTIDTTPPDTSIDDLEVNKRKGLVKFEFSGSDAFGPVTFECALDAKSYSHCESPQTYRNLKEGRHTVSVRAKDAAGNVDPTPAKQKVKI